MIHGIHNGQLRKKPEELKAKSVQALQQQNATRELQKPGQDNKDLAPTEQVARSNELSEELNGAYQQDEHQGLDALLANLMGPQESKKVDHHDQVKEVGKGSEAGKIKENPDKKPKLRELKEDEKRTLKRTKDPKAADRMGNLKVSSKKEGQGVKDRPQQPGEQTHSHHKLGSKGAPKTDAPRPVGAPEQMKGSKPDGRVGSRQLPQMRGGGGDGLDLSEEMKHAIANQKQPAVA